MATPFHHALSSAKRFGGTWHDYVAIHDWFDSSKALVADVRHRALRHHAEGIWAAQARFGTVLTRASDGHEVPTRLLGEQHVWEDFGWIPNATVWLRLVTLAPWMRPDVAVDIPTAVHAAAQAFGVSMADVQPVICWFEAPAAQLADARARLLRHHAHGIVECAATLGEAITCTNGTVINTRAVGAWHVRAVLDTIPAAADWLGAIPLQSWMARGARRLTAELEQLARAAPADIPTAISTHHRSDPCPIASSNHEN